MSTKYDIRKQEILACLKQNGRLSIQELQNLFSLSPASVRRLCAAMEADGCVIRTRGGIRISPNTDHMKYSFESKSTEYYEEKVRIAQAASRAISDNQVIFLESGSTVYQCALSIAERIKNHQLNNIRIFTNSLNNLRVLAPVITTNLIGGEFRFERQDFVGHLTERFLKDLWFDNAIIGSDSINKEGGIMVMDFDTAHVDERLISQTNHVTVVSHSGKFGKRSLVSFATLDDIDTVITDNNLTEEMYKTYSGYSAEILRV